MNRQNPLKQIISKEEVKPAQMLFPASTTSRNSSANTSAPKRNTQPKVRNFGKSNQLNEKKKLHTEFQVLLCDELIRVLITGMLIDFVKKYIPSVSQESICNIDWLK